MNKILLEVKRIMIESVKEHLPEINIEDLEGEGAIYYMNGKNGAEFDWYVNDKISNFMMFYDDENNMGAVKATLYKDGGLLIFVYGDRGKEMIKKIDTFLDVPEEDVLALAVLLKAEGENKKKWDDNIESIDTDYEIDKAAIDEFLSHESYYEEMRMRADMMGQVAYASKKIFEEGWKVGFMSRDESVREGDSGWAFMVGNEDDDYVNDAQNIMLVSIHEMVQYDRALWKYITMPVGTSLIRVSLDEFEVDNNDKEIYLEKMKNE